MFDLARRVLVAIALLVSAHLLHGFDVSRLEVIVVPPERSAALDAAVQDVATVLGEIRGHPVGLIESHWAFPEHALFIGDGLQTRLSLPWIGQGSPLAGTIARRDSRLFIRGRSDEATVTTLMSFAGDHLGARWYWPGPLGYERVEAEPLPRRKRVVPAFDQRTVYPMPGGNDGAFARRNRLNQRYRFNHNLARIFDVELYGERPELFAQIEGRRQEPTGSAGLDPQPNMAHPDAVKVTAKAALEYFEANPDALSFSISTNDNSLFDESDATRKLLEPLGYFRNRPDYSDLVFGFANAVAEEVFDKGGAWETPSGEPRYLGVLAYYWSENVPSFPVHPRVLPVLTSDRAQWHDPAYRAQDKALIDAWSQSGAEKLASWDYFFDAPYLYPRQLNHWIAESIRYQYEHGVRVFFTQVASVWGLGGCKSWFAAQLLWNPHADPDALLQEFYDSFFGPATAPMRRFYEAAEQQRNANEGRAEWIKFYLDEAHIELFPPAVCAQLRTHLAAALARTTAESLYRQRVEAVDRAFQLTERYSEFHHHRRETVLEAFKLMRGTDGGVERLRDLIQDYGDRFATYRDLARVLAKEPLTASTRAFTRRNYIDVRPLALGAYLHAGGDPAALELPLCGFGAGELETYAAYLRGETEATQLLDNPILFRAPESFEPPRFPYPDIPEIDGWSIFVRPAEHTRIRAHPSIPEIGGLSIAGADLVSFRTWTGVRPGDLMELYVKFGYKCSPDNRNLIWIIYLDENKEPIAEDKFVQLPAATEATTQEIRVPTVVPKNARMVRVEFRASRQYPGDYWDVEIVQLNRVAAAGGAMD